MPYHAVFVKVQSYFKSTGRPTLAKSSTKNQFQVGYTHVQLHVGHSTLISGGAGDNSTQPPSQVSLSGIVTHHEMYHIHVSQRGLQLCGSRSMELSSEAYMQCKLYRTI